MSQDREFIAAVVKNLPEPSEEQKQWWIESPLELQGFLANLARKPSPSLNIWKTIKIGTGLKTGKDFSKAIKDNGMNVISDWADDLLSRPEFKTATEEQEVDLVKLTVAELGFKQGARRDQIYDRARELGLELCPAEVSPQLRLQYNNQPNGEWIRIAMEPIRDSDGDLRVFDVGCRDSRLWLFSLYGDPGSFWLAVSRWAFVRPRK